MVAHEWLSIMSSACAAPGLHKYICKDEKRVTAQGSKKTTKSAGCFAAPQQCLTLWITCSNDQLFFTDLAS